MASSLSPSPSLLLLNKQHSENVSSSKWPADNSLGKRSDYFPLLPFSLREKYLEYFFSLGLPLQEKYRYIGMSTAENQD